MTFSSQLKAHRKRLGIKQVEMAEILDLSQRTYWTYESGQSVPHAVTREGCLARLSKVKTP